MKKLYIITLLSSLCGLSNGVNSQNLQWAKQMGSSGYDSGNAVAVDGIGNVYTTGAFQGTTDFDPGAAIYNLTSAGLYDIFISKLDPSGNFIWAKAIGGTNYDQGNSVSVDAMGNVYTTGYFYGTIDFDSDSSSTFNLYGVLRDAFVFKLDSSGNFIWAKRLGGFGFDIGYSLTIDAAGNVYSTGFFHGPADFNPDSLATFNLN